MDLSKCPVELLTKFFFHLDVTTRKMCREVCQQWNQIIMTAPCFTENKVLNLNFCTLSPNRPPMSIFMQSEFKRTKLIVGHAVTFDYSVESSWENIEMITDHITELDWGWWRSRIDPIPTISFKNLTVLRLNFSNNFMWTLLNMYGKSLKTLETIGYAMNPKSIKDVFRLCPKLESIRNVGNITNVRYRDQYFAEVIHILEEYPNLKFHFLAPVSINHIILIKSVEIKVGMDLDVVDLEKIVKLDLQTGANLKEALAPTMSNLKTVVVKYCDEHYLDSPILKLSVEILYVNNDFNFSCTDCFSKFLQCFPNLIKLTVGGRNFNSSAFVEIKRRLPRLRDLCIIHATSDIPNFTPTFENSKLHSLESLLIRMIRNINADDFTNLRRGSPKLTKLHLIMLNFEGPMRETVKLILDLYPKMKNLKLEHYSEFVRRISRQAVVAEPPIVRNFRSIFPNGQEHQQDQLLTAEDIVDIFKEGRGRFLKALTLPLQDESLHDVIRRQLPELCELCETTHFF